MTMNKRLMRYDVLRIIAMLMVVVYHYSTRYQELYGHNGSLPFVPNACATVAVSLFLLLLGFFNRVHDRTGLRQATNYVKHRIFRLVPTYWIAVTITSVVLTLASDMEITPLQYLTNLFLVNRVFAIPSVDGAYWYMTILCVYTVMTAFGIVASKCVSVQTQICMYAATYLVVGVLNILTDFIPYYAAFLLFSYTNKCVIGQIIANIRYGTGRIASNVIVLAVLIFGDALFNPIDTFLCNLFAIALFIAVSLPAQKRSRKIPFVIDILSSATYIIYLVHQKLGFMLISSLETYGVPAFCAVVVTVICALLFGCCYECFARRFRRACLTKSKGRA